MKTFPDIDIELESEEDSIPDEDLPLQGQRRRSEEQPLEGDFSSHACNRDCTVPDLKSLTCKFTLTVQLLHTDQPGRMAAGRNT